MYGLDLISRTDSGGVQEYYLYDGLGSTSDLADGAGNSVASYQYDVFGSIRTQSGSSPNEFKFTGEQVDSTALQYLRARYYDPAIGRFLGQDPVPAGNLYAYVGSNPTRFTDPSGLCVPGITCPPGMERGRGDKEGRNFQPLVRFLPICAPATPKGCPVRSYVMECWDGERWGSCSTGSAGGFWDAVADIANVVGDVTETVYQSLDTIVGCVGSAELIVVGSDLFIAGAATGQPEIAVAGGAVIILGYETYRAYCVP